MRLKFAKDVECIVSLCVRIHDRVDSCAYVVAAIVNLPSSMHTVSICICYRFVVAASKWTLWLDSLYTYNIYILIL